MRLVATTRFREGTRLGKDIPAAAGQAPLLRAGVALTERHREALVRAGVYAVYVNDAVGHGIDVNPALTEQTREEAREALDTAFGEVALMTGQPLSDERIAELQTVADAIAAEVALIGEAVVAFNDLAIADRYTLEHSIDVTAVGLIVGRQLFATRGRIDYRGERDFEGIDLHLTQLGIGLLLHDIGKLAIPAEILHRPGPLLESEWETMKLHPLMGLDMLQGDGVGPRAKSVVRSHHERWDGNGYPAGIAGSDISQFARIAAVADVFDAVTSERAYAPAAPQHVGVQTIRDGAGTQFDPEVVAAFCEVIAPYPPGSEITLSDGSQAVVVSVPAGRLELPLVRVFRDGTGEEIHPVEIDLQGRPELAPAAVLTR
jgi:HD-GYP domain-containing protein (c-di-GMP phosphodiesterase class II)